MNDESPRRGQNTAGAIRRGSSSGQDAGAPSRKRQFEPVSPHSLLHTASQASLQSELPTTPPSQNGGVEGHAGRLPSRLAGTPPPTVLSRAIACIRRGWAPVPIRARTKIPKMRNWTALRITEADAPQYFSDSDNIGNVLGEVSGGLVDIDLDCPEAIELAPKVLPASAAVFGRLHSQIPLPIPRRRKGADDQVFESDHRKDFA